jgi:hypothetical protein
VEWSSSGVLRDPFTVQKKIDNDVNVPDFGTGSCNIQKEITEKYEEKLLPPFEFMYL